MIQDYVRIFYLGDLMLGGTLYWVRDHRKNNNSSKVDDFTFGHMNFYLLWYIQEKVSRKQLEMDIKLRAGKFEMKIFILNHKDISDKYSNGRGFYHFWMMWEWFLSD